MRSRFWQRLLLILSIVGPGIISGSVDNDAGGITTYSIAGASFGYSLLWILLVATFSLAVTQEMGTRLGIVTGKGLASLIREKFGLRWTTGIMALLLIANIGIITAEFAGIAAALEIFHIPRVIAIIVASIAIFLVVTKGTFKQLEKLFLILSAFYLAYIVSAILARPDWGAAFQGLFTPTFSFNKYYLITLIAIVGTTVTPWGQFFIQDYVVDKKISKENLKIARGDVFVGTFLSNFISFFIVVACAATLFRFGIVISNANQAAMALVPLAGKFASILFGFGFLNAALFGAAIVPLTTAYALSDAFGFESGLNLKFKEAPQFYGIFVGSLLFGALLVALPSISLISILFFTQALDAVLLLPVLVIFYLLSNDRKLLGDYVNGKFVNAVTIVTFLIIVVSALLYVGSLFVS